MSARIRVVVLGTGRMGSGIVRLLREKRGIELAGVYGRRRRAQPVDVGDATGLGERLGLSLSTDLPALLAATRPHVVIQATCSRLHDALGEIRAAVEHGANVISIAEEMAFPACQSERVAREIHALALERSVSVLGTGINPGFVLDLLVIALTGVCHAIRSITATRVNDLAPYGPTVLGSQGVGLTPEAFERAAADGSVVGHIGFPESLAMIATAVGWTIDRVEQRREPIVSTVRRVTEFVTVEPGRVAGCAHTAVAYVDGRPAISLCHPQQVHPALEGVQTCDRIEILGTPDVRLCGAPEIPGGIGTVGLAVNLIPRIMDAEPGLKTMADLPVPAAALGDLRTLLRAPPAERDA